MLRGLLETMRDGRQPGAERRVAFVQFGLRRRRRLEQGCRVREPRLRLRQRLPLVARGAERRELRVARGQRVALGSTRRGLPPAAIAALDRFAPGAPGGGDVARQWLDAAESIEQLALRLGPAQRLMRV